MELISKMKGVLVSEEEVATDLGFSNIIEYRRWQTDLGRKVDELQHALRLAQDEAKRFQWHLKRDNVVLKKLHEAVEAHDYPDKDKLLLAIDVVTGKGVDWNHELKDWFEGI